MGGLRPLLTHETTSLKVFQYTVIPPLVSNPRMGGLRPLLTHETTSLKVFQYTVIPPLVSNPRMGGLRPLLTHETTSLKVFQYTVIPPLVSNPRMGGLRPLLTHETTSLKVFQYTVIPPLVSNPRMGGLRPLIYSENGVKILIMIQRACKLPKTNSFFLFGARGSGKTTLLQQLFSEKNSLFVDLLDIKLFDQIVLNPERFLALIDSPENKNKRVIVDEIQKVPRLLDVAHQQIQKRKRQFIFTGSSSRRLKQKGTNLLAGRAWVYHLYPFTRFELGNKFNLKQALEWGTLPSAILAKDKTSAKEYLKAYTGTYLEKEIQQEQWVRKLHPFRRFLFIAAQMNGKIINKSKIANDIGVDDVTVTRYFEILEDTLLGFMLPAFHKSIRKSQKQAPKFYFIDTGITRALSGTLTVKLLPQTTAFGEAFEHWIILEIIKNADYKRLDWDYSYLRTKDGVEIDLIIQSPQQMWLMKIKSKTLIKEEDAKALENIGKSFNSKTEKWLISNDPLERKFGTIRALHWKKALKELFS